MNWDKFIKLIEDSEMQIAFASGSGLGSLLLALVALAFVLRIKMPKKAFKLLWSAVSFNKIGK